MDASVTRGIPVNPPIWWIDPTDEVALAVDDGELRFLKEVKNFFITQFLLTCTWHILWNDENVLMVIKSILESLKLRFR